MESVANYAVQNKYGHMSWPLRIFYLQHNYPDASTALYISLVDRIVPSVVFIEFYLNTRRLGLPHKTFRVYSPVICTFNWWHHAVGWHNFWRKCWKGPGTSRTVFKPFYCYSFNRNSMCCSSGIMPAQTISVLHNKLSSRYDHQSCPLLRMYRA